MFQLEGKIFKTNLDGTVIGMLVKPNGDTFIARQKAGGDVGAPFSTHHVGPDMALYHGHYCETREEAMRDLAERAGIAVSTWPLDQP